MVTSLGKFMWLHHKQPFLEDTKGYNTPMQVQHTTQNSSITNIETTKSAQKVTDAWCEPPQLMYKIWGICTRLLNITHSICATRAWEYGNLPLLGFVKNCWHLVLKLFNGFCLVNPIFKRLPFYNVTPQNPCTGHCLVSEKTSHHIHLIPVVVHRIL